MSWIVFILASAVIIYSGSRLSHYGDQIAQKTSLGGMFVGMLLLAGATSLPEVVTSVVGLYQDAPGIAAGNLLGSNGFNMVLLAIVLFAEARKSILITATVVQALMGTLAAFLIGLVLFFITNRLNLSIGWVGLDSLILICTYALGVSLLRPEKTAPQPEEAPADNKGVRVALLYFAFFAILLISATPFLVTSAEQISTQTGLEASFIGTTLVALVTSLPELTTTFAALKIGAGDMAIGNLFGSNMFNMFALGLADLFYIRGAFFPLIQPDFLIVGISGLVITLLAVIGCLIRDHRRPKRAITTALLIVVIYIAGIWLMFVNS